MTHPFKQLILIALGKSDSLESALSPAQWSYTFAMAKIQAMVGVLWQGVRRLPAEQKPPSDLYEKWEALADMVAAIHRTHTGHIEELKAILKDRGLHACLLKGTSLAALYPEPASRQCGDIDVWVAGSHKDTLRALGQDWHVSGVLWQECKVGFFNDTIVEVHFHPCKMYNPFLNARFQRTMERLSPIRPDEPLTTPGARFNAVFCMAHMYRHYLEGGIGFRQMLDYYFVLHQLDANDRTAVLNDLRHLGMGRFTAAVMHVQTKMFGLEERYLLCAPNSKYGAKLFKEALEMGNFGVMDARNRASADETRLARFARKNARVWSHLRDYPRETFWSPYARIRQHLWRILHHYV